jgi:NADPH2:quinone reductase
MNTGGAVMTKAIVIHETGGPEVLRYEDRLVPAPKAGEALIRHCAVGLNYIDVYYRKGFYPPPALPFVPGGEGSGVVEAVGPDVTDFKPGDRVAYATGPIGSYAELRVFPADKLVKLPESIDFAVAAAMMLKGMTARYLLHATIGIQPGDHILFHAAAGGVGLIACQWAAHLGAEVIGTVGSDEKAELARRNGCGHVINYRKENFVARVREITGGAGVRVVYDSVGRDTFSGSLDCLQPRGMLVSFGQSSGPVPPVDILQLSAKGSLFLTRPVLSAYVATRVELQQTAEDLFGVVASGAVKIAVTARYPLAEAAKAHVELESRATTGSIILMP